MKKIKCTIGLILFLFSLNVYAEMIYVDKSAEGSSDGTSWVNAYNFLTDALEDCEDGDMILIAEGKYYPDQDSTYPYGNGGQGISFMISGKNNILLLGGFESGGTWYRDIEQYETILSGDLGENDGPFNAETIESDPARNDNSENVVRIKNCTGMIILDGLTITAGHDHSNGTGLYSESNDSVSLQDCKIEGNFCEAGSVYTKDDVISFQNCKFKNNLANGTGAGIKTKCKDVSFNQCSFENNHALYGGAIEIDEDQSPENKFVVRIFNSSFVDNFAGEAGGAILVPNYTELTIEGCSFSGNHAEEQGAGLQIDGPYYDVAVKDSVFEDNYCNNNSAAMFCGGDSKLNIDNTIFRGNYCADPDYLAGSQITICNDSNAIITQCSFLENPWCESSSGLLPMIYLRNGSSLDLKYSLFAANNSKGVFLENTNSVYVSNCTWMNNFGAFIYGSSHGLLENCIIYSLGSYNSLNFEGPKPTVRNCDIKKCFPGGIWNAYCGIDGGGNFDSDPCFVDNGDWQTNGSGFSDDVRTVGDYHLKSQAGRWNEQEQHWENDDFSSPCIDAGFGKSPLCDETFPNGGIVNIGRYGGTSQASRSYFGTEPCKQNIAGDINGDCIVDFKDMAFLGAHWLMNMNE